jgi:hypothetical protein
MNPFWDRGHGDVRTTCISSDAKKMPLAAAIGLWGRPPAFAIPENGYTSQNSERIAMRLSCGITIDGEIYPPRPDELFTLTSDRRVTFVRA